MNTIEPDPLKRDETTPNHHSIISSSSKKKRMTDHNPKRGKYAKQWRFIIPSFDNTAVNRLSNLPLRDVDHLVFAIYIDDDNRNRRIEGYIRMRHRVRVPVLLRLVGYGRFSVCGHNERKVIMELKANESCLEFGNGPKILRHRPSKQGERTDLKLFKKLATIGLTENQLNALYPNVFNRYPAFARDCLMKRISV